MSTPSSVVESAWRAALRRGDEERAELTESQTQTETHTHTQVEHTGVKAPAEAGHQRRDRLYWCCQLLPPPRRRGVCDPHQAAKREEWVLLKIPRGDIAATLASRSPSPSLSLPVVCVCWPGRKRARLRAGMCASEEVEAKPNQQNRALAQGCARVRMRARVDVCV